MEDKELIKPDMLASMLMRLFEFAPVAMAISTSHAKTSSYAKVNDAYLKLTGLRWEDISGRKLTSKGSAIDSPARDRRHRMLREQGSYVLEEVDLRHVDGSIIPTLISAQRTVVEGISFDVEIILDVSSRVRHHQEMERALMESARTDFLTGLANRAGLEVEVATRLNLPELDGFALAYIDLNGFKAVNDRLGHHGGDEVLKAIASRLRDSFSNSHFIARIGGDEFVILLPAPSNHLASVLDHLRQAMDHVLRPVSIEGELADVGAAVGVAFSRTGDDVASVMKRADGYMYTAKASGERIAIVCLGAPLIDASIDGHRRTA